MDKKKVLHEVKDFSIWALSYFVAIWLFDNLVVSSLSNFEFMKYRLIYYVLLASFVIVLSTLIDAGANKKRVNFGTYLIYWVAFYAFLFWVFDFLFVRLAGTGNFNFLSHSIWATIALAFILAFVVKFVNRIDPDPDGFGEPFGLPHISLGFFASVIIVVIAYFFAKSSRYFSVNVQHGLPLIAFWLGVAVIVVLIWTSFDEY